jgi:predicted small metal-binding protein
MADAHKLDCESVSETCRFIIQSENEEEAIELAQKHMKEVHGQEITDEELQNDHLQVV